MDILNVIIGIHINFKGSLQREILKHLSINRRIIVQYNKGALDFITVDYCLI